MNDFSREKSLPLGFLDVEEGVKLGSLIPDRLVFKAFYFEPDNSKPSGPLWGGSFTTGEGNRAKALSHVPTNLASATRWELKAGAEFVGPSQNSPLVNLDLNRIGLGVS